MKEFSLDEIRRIQLLILDKVSDFCDDNDIKYYLAYGTLLGAVRHKGYIPWDDDIDIVMPRNDYEKFIMKFNESSYEFQVYTHKIDKCYPWPYAKVSYENTKIYELSDVAYEKLGINIDVFPMDGLPKKKYMKKVLMTMISLKRFLWDIKSIRITSKRSFHKNLILMIGKKLLLKTSVYDLVSMIHDYAQSYKFEDSSEVGCLVWGYGKKEIMCKEYFDEKIKMDFEGDKYYVPLKYAEILGRLYGNYMALPPEEKRITHHDFKAYYR